MAIIDERPFIPPEAENPEAAKVVRNLTVKITLDATEAHERLRDMRDLLKEIKELSKGIEVL
jgi:hypothetical protein